MRENRHPSEFASNTEQHIIYKCRRPPGQISPYHTTMNQLMIPRDLLGKDSFKTGPIAKQFFSKANIDVLHEEIMRWVAEVAGRTIGRQSDRELVIIMREHYLTVGETKIEWMNDFIVNKCVNIVLQEMKLRDRYKSKMLQNPVSELPLPIATTIRNEEPLRGFRSL